MSQRHAYDVDQHGAQAFERAAGGEIVGLQVSHWVAVTVGAAERAAGGSSAFGVMMAARGGQDVVADMAEVLIEVG